jgi:uncharacterized protein (DUF952 family)
MPTILHIAYRDDWQTALALGSYAGPTLEAQGFIHCSQPGQVLAVANARFTGRDHLLLLCIVRELVTVEIRDENLDGGADLFPHLYGPLNVDAVILAADFTESPEGGFTIPAPALALLDRERI